MYPHYSISAELGRQHHNELLAEADAARRGREGRRTPGRLRCRIGLHAWQTHVDRELAGRAAVYDLCRRCSREKPAYGPPTEGQAIGLAAG